MCKAKSIFIHALVFTLCFLSAEISFSQTVTGVVVDEHGQPMEFVNVVLLNSADSTYVNGATTHADGSFSVENTGRETGLAKVTSVGYVPFVRALPPSGRLGRIAMSPDNVMLGEVVVRSNRPVTSIKGNALVTNVERTALAHAGTANDVLSQVPMVSGRDGNFQVFGKGTPVIYVNGRELRDVTELSHINSADIKSVEVITSPGAKYGGTVKSVIRVRTKRPQGEGWSGTLRTQNGFQDYFATRNQANLKYRSGELEVFANMGYLNGKFPGHKYNDMYTYGTRLINQRIDSNGSMRNNEFYGKAGFSYLFSEKHSIGAYYSNGLNVQNETGGYGSEVTIDGQLDDEISSRGRNKRRGYPRHYANLYYNGEVGKLGIDLNVDYLWNKNRSELLNEEEGSNSGHSLVNSLGSNHGRMLAQKLALSYPVWKGALEIGEEYASSRFMSDYATDAAIVEDNSSRVEENNIAGFAQLTQRFGNFEVSAGLRYEHVDFSYRENGEDRPERDKTYDNLFPSVSLSAMLGNAQLALSYSHKTRRPSYGDLDGTVDYINRFTLESGNQYLKPERIHTVELMGAWRQFFGQVSFTYNGNPMLYTTTPYDESGEVKLITKDNLSAVKKLQVFLGVQFQLGIWQPKVNLGMLKQWLTIDYRSGRERLGNPIALAQWQNALHLPGDVWLNLDMQWMSAGNEDNMKVKSSSYVNAKLYKAFFHDRLGVTLEVNDLFNKSGQDKTLYSKDVMMYQVDKTNFRVVLLTLQYNFNLTKDRYRGSGAGQEEKARF